MVFYTSCLHFTGASSLKILFLLPPAGVAAIHYEALFKISTKVTSGSAVLNQCRCVQQANEHESISRFRSNTDYQKCHLVLVSKTMYCPVSLICNHFYEVFLKVVYTANIFMQNYKEKGQHTVSPSPFFPLSLPTFSPFSWCSQHVNYFLALLLPLSSSFLDTKPGSCGSGVQISIPWHSICTQ